jgi:hypothetical protein
MSTLEEAVMGFMGRMGIATAEPEPSAATADGAEA